MPVTMFAVAMALERHPDAAKAMVAAGPRDREPWLALDQLSPASTRRPSATICTAPSPASRSLTGERAPWLVHRPHQRADAQRLVAEEGGFLYDADSYADDLPYWVKVAGRDHLIVPYTLDANDMRFATAQGFNTGDQFFTYLRDSFDTLYAEGRPAPLR
jgi:peptidoglycan/xylan/chitin deacetylase (PgdA/CDA1 family)